jgi:GxxExxY protein
VSLLRAVKLRFDIRETGVPSGELKRVKLDCGYCLAIVLEKSVIIELKTVEGLLLIHDARLLTYLELTGITIGLLINFDVPLLKDGIKRIVNNFVDFSASPRLCGDKLPPR